MARFHDDSGHILDTKFGLKDNADPTKKLVFELSGIATATERTITVPDASITLENATAQIYLTEATTAVTAAERGKTFVATKASLTQTFTLPSAATAGLKYRFVCGNAAGEILINPAVAQTILCKATVDQGASVAPAAGTGIKNTALTNVLGDMMTLVSDGVTGWYMVAQSGIWASQ